jgi:hypothetical protein
VELDRHPDEFAALAELAEIFSELVEIFYAAEHADLSPERIVEIAARCMPRSQAVALVMSEDGSTSVVASTNGIGERISRIRSEVAEGPSIDVLETNDLVVCDDLTDDERWPEFGRRVVAETGVRSIATYRLYLGRGSRAALNFYSDWPYAFDEVAISTGCIFASYCSLALLTSRVLGEPLSAVRTAEVHREIGVAVGILMHAHGVDTGTAYGRLQRSARELRKSLPEVAQYVERHRELPS